MTIQNILKHHGFNCARTVLPSGKLVFATARAGPVAAVGLPMTSHTFHGGDEPADSANEIAWWLEPDALGRDLEAMGRYFPDFMLLPGDSGSAAAWYGPMNTQLGSFQIAVIHRFDHALPLVVPLQPSARGRRVGRRMVAAPHMYLNGNLCVAAGDDWDAQRDTIATVVAWASHWHAFYVEWFFTGKWPAEQYVAEAS